MRQEEIIFEYTTVGSYTKIAAVHVSSGIETVLICPAKMSRTLQQNAAKFKLKRMLEKRGRRLS